MSSSWDELVSQVAHRQVARREAELDREAILLRHATELRRVWKVANRAQREGARHCAPSRRKTRSDCQESAHRARTADRPVVHRDRRTRLRPRLLPQHVPSRPRGDPRLSSPPTGRPRPASLQALFEAQTQGDYREARESYDAAVAHYEKKVKRHLGLPAAEKRAHERRWDEIATTIALGAVTAVQPRAKRSSRGDLIGGTDRNHPHTQPSGGAALPAGAGRLRGLPRQVTSSTRRPREVTVMRPPLSRLSIGVTVLTPTRARSSGRR